MLAIKNEGPCPASCRLSVFRVTNLPQLHAQGRLAAMAEERMLAGTLIGTRGSAHQDPALHTRYRPPRCQLESRYQRNGGFNAVRRAFGNVLKFSYERMSAFCIDLIEDLGFFMYYHWIGMY